MMHWEGVEVRKDREKAIKYFIKAAEASHSGAQSYLGKIHFGMELIVFLGSSVAC
jgi:TPR repeat protein